VITATPGKMTSHVRQDAREKAGLLRKFDEGYGATTQRHVRFEGVDAKVKVKHQDGDIEVVDCDVLLGWDELCKSDLPSSSAPVPGCTKKAC